MLKIAINHEVVAVSETMESALKALPELIHTYAGVGNSKCIEWSNNGIIVNPQCNIAHTSVKVADIDLDIFICKINVV